MNRLQKKCFIASAGAHLLLVLLLLIGPGFLAPSSKPVDVPVLDFVPVKTVDSLMSNSGGASVKSPPAAIPAPPAPPAAPPEPLPPAETPEAAPKEIVKDVTPPKSNDESLEVTDKPRKPVISLERVTRKRDPKDDARAIADAEAKESARQAADARRRAANALEHAANSIGGGASGSTSVSVGSGDGRGSGVSYANFLQAVKSAYVRALVIPDSLTDENATTVASVTIARDGTVISSHITRLSGDHELDRAVQRTLDRVKYAAPLPDDAKEDQRTVEINFNAKSAGRLG
jgi:TonB family protein